MDAPRFRSVIVPLATILMAMLLDLPGVFASGAEVITDRQISHTVENKLFLDPGVSGQGIDVQVNQGIATLSGTANNLLTKERSVAIAEAVKGVRAVIDRLQVIPSGHPDELVKEDVQAALAANPRTEAYDVKVAVNQGKVTLTGRVESWQEKRFIDNTVKSVRGVREMNNQIEVVYQTDRSDMEIKEDIQGVLYWDVLVDSTLIEVKVNNGQVVLEGTVGSAAEKSRAILDAWVTGVKSVDGDRLEVAHWARDKDLHHNKYADKTDPQIKDAIQDALRFDPRIAPFVVDVSVINGVVTLRGAVDSLATKRAAAQIARNTVGVWRVINRIRVQPIEPPSDEQIASNVRQALLRDPYVENRRIKVSVEDGEVTLNGIVDNTFEKAQAEDVTSRITGVVRVNNNLALIEGDSFTYSP